MWNLILANSRYQARTAMSGLLIVLSLATAVNVGLPLFGLGPRPEDDFKLFYLYPVLIVFLGMGLAFAEFGSQRREFRLHLTALLPRTLTQVGLARILSPVVALLGCLALAVIVMLALQWVMGTGVVAWRTYILTYFAGLFFIVTQLVVLREESLPVLKRSRLAQVLVSGALLVFSLVMLLRGLSPYIHLVPQATATLRPSIALNPKVLSSTLWLHGIGWLMVVISVALFRSRRSLIE